MRTHKLAGFSSQTDGPRKRLGVSSVTSLILLIVFPSVLSNYNAQDGMDLRESSSGSCNLGFWKGFHEKLASLEADALIHPQDANAHYQYGKLCLRGLRTANGARDAFQKAISLRPDFAEAYNGLGWAYFDLWGMRAALGGSPPIPDVQHAIEAFELAIDRKPDYADAYLGLGCAYVWMGRPEKALIHLQRVIELDPNRGEAWDLISGAYEALAQYEEAIGARLQNMLSVSDKNRETALDCDHYLPEPHLGIYLHLIELGRLYEKTKRYDAAIQTYEHAIERNPGEPQGYHHLGLAYFAKGDKASALFQYGRLQGICLHADAEGACEHFAEDLINRIYE